MNNDVVITGFGVVAPLGADVPTFRRRMFAGESGIVSIRGNEEPQNFPVPFAALVPKQSLRVPPHLDSSKKHPDAIVFASLSAEEALRDIPRDLKFDGVVYGTAEGVHFGMMREAFKHVTEPGFDWVESYSEGSVDSMMNLMDHLGFQQKPPKDSQICINSACATGNMALGLAMQRIRSGQWTRAIAGAVEARCCSYNFLNFYMLDALTVDDTYPPHQASRPFSKDRSGFVRGEGAATLILESRSAAEARGAKIYGVIKGYGNTSDAFRLTDGRDDGSAVVQSMATAIRDAGLNPEDIDYISAHGTSTPLNDRLESLAIKTLFKEQAYKLPISSLKSQIGHPAVAAGAIEAVACILMLQDQKIAPTMNCNVPDPECDLDYVPNQSRDSNVRTILSNNFGFGGQNACIVFERN